MTADPSASTATELAESLRGRIASPWELFLERTRRFEVHLNGDHVEMRRGPIEQLGFGLRIFRPAGERLGVGTAAGSDLSPDSLHRAVRDAEETAPLAPSAAKRIELPNLRSPPATDLGIRDGKLWADPLETVSSYAHELLSGVEDRGSVVPSFGSIRASLIETSMANSEGGSGAYPSTLVEMELAVKAFGGPEGRPPGEYWVVRRTRSVPLQGVRTEVAEWSERARDVRRAVPTEAGISRVVMPATVLADVLPTILGFRFSAPAAIQKMAPAPGDRVASERFSAADDGRYPGSAGTAPTDDEGRPHGRTALVEGGKFLGLIADTLSGSALGVPATGHGHRDSLLLAPSARYSTSVQTVPTTVVVSTGSDGSDAELMEQAGEGIWLDQLGYAFPDQVSSSFGGEIRLGYRIRGGKRAEPIRGGTVGGFTLGPSATPALLDSIRAVGSRPTLSGRLVSPTILFDGFPIAGGA